MRKGRFFTLLELLIVCLILAFGAALTGVKVQELYREQQFLSASKQVMSQLALAQDLMLMMDTDVWVHFKVNSKEGTTLKIEVERPIQERWTKIIERELILPSIKKIQFDGRSDKDLSVRFSLGKMTRGRLELVGRDKEEIQEVFLYGYPVPIGEKESLLLNEEKLSRSEHFFPSLIFQELYEKKEAKK